MTVDECCGAKGKGGGDECCFFMIKHKNIREIKKYTLYSRVCFH